MQRRDGYREAKRPAREGQSLAACLHPSNRLPRGKLLEHTGRRIDTCHAVTVVRKPPRKQPRATTDVEHRAGRLGQRLDKGYPTFEVMLHHVRGEAAVVAGGDV